MMLMSGDNILSVTQPASFTIVMMFKEYSSMIMIVYLIVVSLTIITYDHHLQS